MLTKAELIQLFDVLGTPPRGRELILSARTSAKKSLTISNGTSVKSQASASQH